MTPLVMPANPSPLKVLEIDGINPLGQFPALLCAWVRHFATSKVTTAIQANGYRMKMLYTCYEKAGRRFTCMSHTARGNTAEHTLHRGNCGDVRNMQQKRSVMSKICQQQQKKIQKCKKKKEKKRIYRHDKYLISVSVCHLCEPSHRIPKDGIRTVPFARGDCCCCHRRRSQLAYWIGSRMRRRAWW